MSWTVTGRRSRGGPPAVTGILVALNVAAYLATGLRSPGGLNDPSGSRLFQDWELVPWFVHENGNYYRLITAAFLHLSPLHILLNMFCLVVTGPALEHFLGRWRFAALYVLGGLGGSVAIYLFGDPIGAVAGASGAIFGLFAACLVCVRKLGLDLTWLVATIGINFAFTFASAGISKLAHVGGFVIGGIAALAIAGAPKRASLLPVNRQAAGLVALAVVLVVAVVVRTASDMAVA